MNRFLVTLRPFKNKVAGRNPMTSVLHVDQVSAERVTWFPDAFTQTEQLLTAGNKHPQCF